MRVPLEALPSMSKLFLDYIQGSDSACQFYPHRPSLDAVEEFARGCPSIDDAHRNRLADALESQHEGWNVDTTSIKKLRSGAVAVVTGQQAGLLTGPMYSILKALTAVKIARQLDERGVAAVPVFWIAAEDHDHEEIEWAGILSQDSTLEKVTSPLPNPDRAPVGWLRFGSSLPDAIEECFRLLPPSEFAAEVRTLIEGAYSPEVSPVEAFARMMGGLFEGSGLILADPLSPPLRSIEKDAIAGVARRAEDVRSALAARTQMIIRAGYSEQVRVGRNFTGFFAYREGSRVSLEPEKDLAGLDLSPNVLLRPVVQDSMFPTVAFVGGPAEVAYMAQAGSAYECLGKPCAACVSEDHSNVGGTACRPCHEEIRSGYRRRVRGYGSTQNQSCRINVRSRGFRRRPPACVGPDPASRSGHGRGGPYTRRGFGQCCSKDNASGGYPSFAFRKG